VISHGPIRAALVSHLEGDNPTMLSRITAKVSRDGPMARRDDPHDGRAVLLLATEPGRRLRRRIQAERNDAPGRRFQSLPASQRQLLVDAPPAPKALAEPLLDQAG
jgi:DNA-binding MarR family transcriptional regulator